MVPAEARFYDGPVTPLGTTPPPSLILRGEAGFEQAVTDGLFNVIVPDGRPDAVLYPRTEADVVAAVRDAFAAGERIVVRSGGHSWVASSVRADGVLIDLAHLDGVMIDAAERTATVGPAVRGRDLSTALMNAGLAFPVGHCGDPAVGGFLLGGGLGVNWGHWRPACFSIRSLRVATADGEVRTASASENADLFWLARGSGPGFPGIVTSIELELQPLPAVIRVATWRFALSALADVTRWITDASPALPTNVEVSQVTAGAERPGGLGASEPHPLVIGVAATVFAADEAEADRALAPLGDGPGQVAPLHYEVFDDVPFDSLHEAVDATYPRGARYLADTFWTDGDLAAASAPLAGLMERAPSGKSYVLAGMPANGDGAALTPPGEAAYGMHDRTLLNVYVIWDDPADDAVNRAWLDEVAAALLPTATGHFLSEADIRCAPARVERSFTPDDWARVQRLRAEFDPEGVFHGFPT